MKISDLFNDKNSINEKSFIGFLAFLVMIAFAITDIITGIYGKDLILNEYIFNAFLILVLGAFGIAGIEKIMNRKTDSNEQNKEEGN
jgi:uncharacterized PurR-regulated membrane protein YhhQ (DUF165 family)